MVETRIPVTDIQSGEFVVRVGQRDIGKTVHTVTPVAAGTPMRGPRGGRWLVTASGVYVRLVTVGVLTGPIVRADATAVVLRDTAE